MAPAAPGTLSKLAAMKGATWGTLASLGSNHRMPFKSATIDQAVDTVPNDTIAGYAERQSPFLGNKRIEGSVVVMGDYRQHSLLDAAFVGEDGSPSTVDTSAYLHTMLWTPHQSGLFLSMGIDRGGAVVREFHSVKVGRRLIASRAGGTMEKTFDLLGRGLTKGGSSSSWSYRYSPVDGAAKPILHSHGVWRFNAQSGGALGSSDKVYPVTFEFEAARALTMENVDAGEGEEPVPGDFAEVTLRMTFYGLTAALATLFRDSYESKTPLKGDVVYTDTSGLLGAVSAVRYLSFYFPKLVVTECPEEIPGAGVVPFRVTMSAHAVSTAPTGFDAAYLSAFAELHQMDLATDSLA